MRAITCDWWTRDLRVSVRRVSTVCSCYIVVLYRSQTVNRDSDTCHFTHRCPQLLVKNDTFRTLATDTDFKGKVREDMLIRLLEAFVWRSQGELEYGGHMRRDEMVG
jgi:hypothetical protein